MPILCIYFPFFVLEILKPFYNLVNVSLLDCQQLKPMESYFNILIIFYKAFPNL